jgi:hypothetical protein
MLDLWHDIVYALRALGRDLMFVLTAALLV